MFRRMDVHEFRGELGEAIASERARDEDTFEQPSIITDPTKDHAFRASQAAFMATNSLLVNTIC